MQPLTRHLSGSCPHSHSTCVPFPICPHTPFLLRFHAPTPHLALPTLFSVPLPPPFLSPCSSPRYQVCYLSSISIVNHPGTPNLQSMTEVSHGELWWPWCVCLSLLCVKTEGGGEGGGAKNRIFWESLKSC